MIQRQRLHDIDTIDPALRLRSHEAAQQRRRGHAYPEIVDGRRDVERIPGVHLCEFVDQMRQLDLQMGGEGTGVEVNTLAAQAPREVGARKLAD